MVCELTSRNSTKANGERETTHDYTPYACIDIYIYMYTTHAKNTGADCLGLGPFFYGYGISSVSMSSGEASSLGQV